MGRIWRAVWVEAWIDVESRTCWRWCRCCALAEVFPFFAAPENLEAITPPLAAFDFDAEPDTDAGGALIDYRISLRGIPFAVADAGLMRMSRPGCSLIARSAARTCCRSTRTF